MRKNGDPFTLVPFEAGVYLVRRGPLVKIGYATQVEKRLQQIKAEETVCVVPCASAAEARFVEAAFHYLLEDYHYAGEWFVASRNVEWEDWEETGEVVRAALAEHERRLGDVGIPRKMEVHALSAGLHEGTGEWWRYNLARERVRKRLRSLVRKFCVIPFGLEGGGSV